MASFSKMLLQKEELEQKHLHLVQIVESEKTAKWQYTQQCEELTMEIKKLRAEVRPSCPSAFVFVCMNDLVAGSKKVDCNTPAMSVVMTDSIPVYRPGADC